MERIEWLDSNMSSHWHKSSDQKYSPMRCTTFGTLVDEGDDYVALAGSVADAAEYDVSDVMVIPKVAITKRQKIKQPRK